MVSPRQRKRSMLSPVGSLHRWQASIRQSEWGSRLRFAPSMPTNADGSYSTELTTTWQLPDGSWANVPSLWMGENGPQQFNPDDEDGILGAMQQFEAANGQTFPRFGSLAEAEAAAQVRSNAGGAGASQVAQAGEPDLSQIPVTAGGNAGVAQPGQQPQMDPALLMQVLGNPFMDEGTKAYAQAMLQQQMQANDPVRALDMDYKRAQIGALNAKASGLADPAKVQSSTILDDGTSVLVMNDGKRRVLAKPLTSMTIDEVLAAQRGWSKNHGSSAAGGYQFMRNTLSDLKEELGLRGSQKLDPDLQDRLGYHLLKRRGYEDFMAGTISRIEFGKRLAMEWASFPVLAGTKGQKRTVKRGQSFYVGDGINKALVAPDVVEAMLDRVKAAGNAVEVITPKASNSKTSSDKSEGLVTTPDATKPEPVAKSKRFWTWFGTAFAGGGGLSLSAFGALDW